MNSKLDATVIGAVFFIVGLGFTWAMMVYVGGKNYDCIEREALAQVLDHDWRGRK